MQSSNNLSQAFHLSGSNKTFLVNLKPDDGLEAAIDAAERLIRTALSADLPERLRVNLPSGVPIPKPKFLRQGSRAYDTINDPLRDSVHYNQADSDVGVYLPMEFVKEAAPTPKLGAEALREAVLAILTALAKTQHWKVKSKSCCIRVYIRGDAHVDVTSYAIPQARYLEMRESASLRRALNAAFADAEYDEDEITWDEVPFAVHLATLDGWIRSDAKAIHEKIQNTYILKGPIFKRCVRFIKGLRDYADDQGGPCSIAITLVVADNLDLGLCKLERDDLAVYSMLNVVADALFQHLPTPGNEDVDILADIPLDIRMRLAQRLRACSEVMRQALYDLPLDRAHAALKTIFGSRFPDAEAQQTPNETSAVTKVVPVVFASSSSVKAVAPRGNARSS